MFSLAVVIILVLIGLLVEELSPFRAATMPARIDA